ncbi:MAG: hypothetical protein AAGG08_16060, partial [Actinomycetota bacterium]
MIEVDAADDGGLAPGDVVLDITLRQDRVERRFGVIRDRARDTALRVVERFLAGDRSAQQKRRTLGSGEFRVVDRLRETGVLVKRDPQILKPTGLGDATERVVEGLGDAQVRLRCLELIGAD